MSKTKLELTWIGKDKRPKLEPRILLEDPSKSYHAGQKITDNDLFDNKLIFGDNLLALKALEQNYTGKVKCVFIDPPYNTGSAFEHYDDGIEHSIWLSLMRDRLVLIRRLLSEDGSLWITIDDNESHYLKVLCDEIFGRINFVSNAIWHKKYTVANDAKWLSENHDHILVYAKSKEVWRPNRLPRSSDMDKRYSNPDNHLKGPWKATPLYAKRKGSAKEQAFTYTFKNGYIWSPPNGASPRFPEYKLREMDLNDEIWFGVKGNTSPSRKTFLSELKIEGTPAPTIWGHSEVGHNHQATEEVKALTPNIAFSTPKPEKLLERIIFLATKEGDLVLDSFAGSGTTGAVAQKMGRKWIMVELGDHCHTHIIPRLQKVIDGEDQGGISKAVNWQGGGGFRYYSLAPSLLQKDQWDNWIINKEYNAEMLAEAVCKLEGFTYKPSDVDWWNHGFSTETDFIFVTTQNLSVEKLEKLSEDVGRDRSLLVLCGAFRCKPDRFANLTIKKMPKTVMKHCEWAHDDYSLNVQNLPMADLDPEQNTLDL
jgi:adenine-specific DNA-methyltransferase